MYPLHFELLSTFLGAGEAVLSLSLFRMRQQRHLIPPQPLRRNRITDLRLRLDRLHLRERFVVAVLLAEVLEEARARRHRAAGRDG